MGLHLLTIVFLLCFELSRCQGQAADSTASAREFISQPQDPQYVEFIGNYSSTHECLCTMIGRSEYNFECKIYNRSLSKSSDVPCSELPTRIVSKLTIECTECKECVKVNLHELTKRHNDSQHGMTVYPPPELYINDCQVDYLNIGMHQLDVENVSLTNTMEVAQFGVPERPGVGGYHTVHVSYPTNFYDTDCWLTYLHITNSNVWFLPTYVMHKCRRLRSISIVDSLITWVSMVDLLALRGIDSLTLSNCGVNTFANDALQVALDSLDEYIQHGNSTFRQNNRTHEALKKLHQMRDDSGRLNMVTYLYDMLDTADIRFALLFGYRVTNDDEHNADIPHGIGLSYLNLAYNSMTEIPFSISMFGYLSILNLSHNEITSLYSSWICWYPPIPDSEKNSSSRHCYWFRGSRETLKVLDLSYNKIDLIGEIQPWHGVALAELYLQHNPILNINSDAFYYSMLASSLLILNLDNTKLSYFHLWCLTRLETLSIENSDVANIEPYSLPNSKSLSRIKLSNNVISAIASNVFSSLDALDSIDLRNNKMGHFFYDSFVMANRSTLGSRVVLYIDGQNNETICDCNHVYAQILIEQSGMPKKHYIYPRIVNSQEAMCEFFSVATNGSKIRKSLNDSQYRDFICEFHGDAQHTLPPNYCHKENSTDIEGYRDSTNGSYCWVTCVKGCECYHSQHWDLADLNCRNVDVDMVRIILEYPIKYMDMSGIGSGYLRCISAGTFKWKYDDLSDVLLVLYLNNSGVHFIENGAFRKTKNLVVLNLHDNLIKTVSADALCPIGDSLHELTLHSNSLEFIQPEIFSATCLTNIMKLTLSSNPWKCSCETQWLHLHKTLINVSRTTQAVSDFDEMQCEIDPTILYQCQLKVQNSESWPECNKVLNSTANYLINDLGNLINLCSKIDDSEKEQRKLIAMSAFGGVFGVVLVALLCLAIRRRHRLFAVVRVLILLRYQRDRRIRQQVTRDSIRYDAMLWAADRDQDRLADVLNRVKSVSGAEELELCVPQSFLYSSLCSCPLTYFDCPAEGAKYSGKVVVALSERFLDTEYLALCQVIRELDSLGRNPFRDIVFLRLSRDVTLRRHQRRHREVADAGDGEFSAASEGSEDVEAFKTLQRILASSDIVYDSVDWEYRLVRRIRSRGSTTVAATNERQLRGSENESSGSEILRDLPSDQQPLVLDIEPTPEMAAFVVRRDDWPPFYSDKVAELFIMSVTNADSSGESSTCAATKTIIHQIVKRMTGVRLGTNDKALLHIWPDQAEQPTVTEADQINSYMMKRTRQFVLLLSTNLLDWFRNDADLQCEFETFLAGNTFRRRMLVILVGQVDTRSGHRYEALANQRLLDDVEPEQTPNWCDMTTDDGDTERLGNWLDKVLYKCSSLLRTLG